MPITGKGVRGDDAGQMGRPAGRGDNHPQAAGGRHRGILADDLRRAVGAHHLNFMDTSNSSSTSAAALIFGQSLSLPITMPTRGVLRSGMGEGFRVQGSGDEGAGIGDRAEYGVQAVTLVVRIPKILNPEPTSQTSHYTALRTFRRRPGW